MSRLHVEPILWLVHTADADETKLSWQRPLHV